MDEAFSIILDRLEKLKLPFPDECYYGDINILIDKTKEIVQEVAEEYNGGWIPCSERLPKYDAEYFKKHNNHRQYIVMCKDAYAPALAYFSEEKKWYYDDFVKFNNVIAWRQLPEPFKKGERENE